MRYICLKSLCYIIYKMDPLLNEYLVFGYENLVKRFRLGHTMCVCSMRNFNEEYRDLFNNHNDVMLECALDGVSCDKEYEDVLIHGIPRINIKREYNKNVTITRSEERRVGKEWRSRWSPYP